MGKPDPTRALREQLARREYTPPVRELPQVIALLDDDPAAADAARALGRVERPVALSSLRAATPTPAVVRALGQLGRGDDATTTALVAWLADSATAWRVRREAAIALGKLGGEAARGALVATLADPSAPPEHRRSVVEALGKVGGDAALAALTSVSPGDDAELARRLGRARLMIERDQARAAAPPDAGGLDLDVALPAGATLIVRCRDGLAPLLADELGEGAQVLGPGTVRVDGARALPRAATARLGLTVGVRLAMPTLDDEVGTVVAPLVAPATVAYLTRATRGPVRWRLDVTSAGHRRGLVWSVAQAVRAAAPTLVNDPTQTTWDVVVDFHARALELRPRGVGAARFAYRVADVPAASHPTIAAALARLAGSEADDVGWDPFCGSGTELIERARLGPARALVGSDLDERALAAAAANVAAAGLGDRIALRRGDATQDAPAGVTLIVTNPPLGRRLRGDVGALLDAFVDHAAAVLAPGGRLVWVTPLPRRTDDRLRARGLVLERDLPVDLGGFDAPMQRWRQRR